MLKVSWILDAGFWPQWKQGIHQGKATREDTRYARKRINPGLCSFRATQLTVKQGDRFIPPPNSREAHIYPAAGGPLDLAVARTISTCLYHGTSGVAQPQMNSSSPWECDTWLTRPPPNDIETPLGYSQALGTGGEVRLVYQEDRILS